MEDEADKEPSGGGHGSSSSGVNAMCSCRLPCGGHCLDCEGGEVALVSVNEYPIRNMLP